MKKSAKSEICGDARFARAWFYFTKNEARLDVLQM